MFNFPIFLSCILFARLPKHSQKCKRRLFGTAMHLSLFSPRGVCVWGGIPWGLDSQSSHYPQEFDSQLRYGGGTLDASASISRKMSKFEGISREF